MNTVTIPVFNFLVIVLISTVSVGMEIDCNNKAFMCSGAKQFYPCVRIGENKTVIVLEAHYCREGFVCNDDADSGCQELEYQANSIFATKDPNSEITFSLNKAKDSEFDTKSNESELANNLRDFREDSHTLGSNGVQLSETTVTKSITDSFTHDTTATKAISTTTPISREFTNDHSTYVSINNDKANLTSEVETELTTAGYFEEYIAESNTKADQGLGKPYTSITYSNHSLEIGSNVYVTSQIPNSNGSIDISNVYSTESINTDSAGYNTHSITETFENHTNSISEQEFSSLKPNDSSSEFGEGIDKIGNILITGKNSSVNYFTSMLGYNSSQNDDKVSNIQSLEDRNIGIVAKNKTETVASSAFNQIKAEDIVSRNDKHDINISVAERPYNREENATISAIAVNPTTNRNDLQDDLVATNGVVIEGIRFPTETAEETIYIENENYSIDGVPKNHKFETGSTQSNEISMDSGKLENEESYGQIHDVHNYTIISATSFGDKIKNDTFDATVNVAVGATESVTTADDRGNKYNSREISADEENELAISKEISYVMTNGMSITSTSADENATVVTNNIPTNFPEQLDFDGSEATNVELATPLVNSSEIHQNVANGVSSSTPSNIHAVANTETPVIPNGDSTTLNITKLIKNQNNSKPISNIDAITTETSLVEMQSTYSIQNSTSHPNPGSKQQVDVESEFAVTNEIITVDTSTEGTSVVPVEVSIESINGIAPTTNSSMETTSKGFLENSDPKAEVSIINDLPSAEGSSYEKKETDFSVAIGKEVSIAEESTVSNFHEPNTVNDAGQLSDITGTTIITSGSDLLNIGRKMDNFTSNDGDWIGLNTQLSTSSEPSYKSVLNGNTATTMINKINAPQESNVPASIEATNTLNEEKLDSVISNEITNRSIDEKGKSYTLSLITELAEKSRFPNELNSVSDPGGSTNEATGKTIMSSTSNLLEIGNDHNKFSYRTQDGVNLSAETSLPNKPIYRSTIDASAATEVAINSMTNTPKEGGRTTNNEATIAWYNKELDTSIASNSTERSVPSFTISSDKIVIKENSYHNNIFAFNTAQNVQSLSVEQNLNNSIGNGTAEAQVDDKGGRNSLFAITNNAISFEKGGNNNSLPESSTVEGVDESIHQNTYSGASPLVLSSIKDEENTFVGSSERIDANSLSNQFTTINTNTESADVGSITNLFENDASITSNTASIGLDEEQYDSPVVSGTTESSTVDQKMETISSFLIQERSNERDPTTVKILGENINETVTSETTPSTLHLLGSGNEENKFSSDTEDKSHFSPSEEQSADIAAHEEDVTTTNNDVLNGLYRQEHDSLLTNNATESSEIDSVYEVTNSTVIFSASEAASIKVVEHDTFTDSQLLSPEEAIFESLTNSNITFAGNTTSEPKDNATNTSTGVQAVLENNEPDSVIRITENSDFDRVWKNNSSLTSEESDIDGDLYETSTVRNLGENMYEITTSAIMPSLSDIIGIKVEGNKFGNGSGERISTNSQLSATFEILGNTNSTSADRTVNVFEEDDVTIGNGVSAVLDDQQRDGANGVIPENLESAEVKKNSFAIEERNDNNHPDKFRTVTNLSEDNNDTIGSTIVPLLSDILNIKSDENKLAISVESDTSTNSQLSLPNESVTESKVHANATITETLNTINRLQVHATKGNKSTEHNHETNNLTPNKTVVSPTDEKRETNSLVEMTSDATGIENSSSSSSGSNDLYDFNTLDNTGQTTETTTPSMYNLVSLEEEKQRITNSVEENSNSPFVPPEEFSLELSTDVNASIAVVMDSIMNMFEENVTIVNDIIPTVRDKHKVDKQIVSKTTQSSVDSKEKTDSVTLVIEEIHSKDESSYNNDVNGVQMVENFDEGTLETSNDGMPSVFPTISSILNTVEGDVTMNVMNGNILDNSIVITEAVHNSEIINGNTVESSAGKGGTDVIYTLPQVYSSTIEETESSTVEVVVSNNNPSINLKDELDESARITEGNLSTKPYDVLMIEGGNVTNSMWEISSVSNRTVNTSAEKNGDDTTSHSNMVFEVTNTERDLNNVSAENKLDIATPTTLNVIESERTPDISYTYIRETSKPYDKPALTYSVPPEIYANLNTIDNISNTLDIKREGSETESAPGETSVNFSTGEIESSPSKMESVTKRQEQSSSKPINTNSNMSPTSTKISPKPIETTTASGNGLSWNILNLTRITQNVETTTVQAPPSSINSLHSSESDEEFVCQTNGRFSDSKNCSIYHTCIGINSKFLHLSTVCPRGTLYDSITQNCTDNPDGCPGSTALVCNSSGIFSHPTNCNRYYKCFWRPINKKYALWLFKCPPHMGYDSKNRKCVSAALLPHCGNVSETLGDVTESPFFCTENGRFPMEYNCEGYYDCKEKKGAFQVKVKTCSEGKLFDRELGRCRKSDLVFCPYEYDNFVEDNSKESEAH